MSAFVRLSLSAVLGAGLVSASFLTQACAEDRVVEVTLQSDRFTPAEIKVPAGQSLTFKLTNKETAPVEFEAKDMKIEKVVPSGGSATVRVKALKPGRYLIVNEYREDVAKAYIVAE